MTYFGFLAIFLLLPIAILTGTLWRDFRRGRETAVELRAWPAWAAIGLHVLVAVAYTTPWDNFLVATRVWWYDPALVTGVTLGWVPIEEYTFFILQPILGGVWLLFLARRIVPDGQPLRPLLRRQLPLLIIPLWVLAVVILIIGWQPGTYLALELAWALPPILLQLTFGADILWQNRKLVLMTIIPLTLYLSTADALAIGWGTWTINPAKSLNIMLGGILPVEEFIFFLLTNTLVTGGTVLILAKSSHRRIRSWQNRVRSDTILHEHSPEL